MSWGIDNLPYGVYSLPGQEPRVGVRYGDKVLDLAAGTAVSTVELAASGAWCVAADFSVGMLSAGRGRDVPKAEALA